MKKDTAPAGCLLSLLLEDAPGALARVVGLFHQRGFNISTLSVAPTHQENLSRVTITLTATHEQQIQLSKQLNKLVDVLKVKLHRGEEEPLEREIALIKFDAAHPQHRDDIMRLATVFEARVIDMSSKHKVLQVSGSSKRIDRILEAADHLSVIEVARSGTIAVSRCGDGKGRALNL